MIFIFLEGGGRLKTIFGSKNITFYEKSLSWLVFLLGEDNATTSIRWGGGINPYQIFQHPHYCFQFNWAFLLIQEKEFKTIAFDFL